MKIWIGNKFIDSSYFRTWCLDEEFNLVYFIYQPKGGYQGEFSLPLLFSNAEEADASTMRHGTPLPTARRRYGVWTRR